MFAGCTTDKENKVAQILLFTVYEIKKKTVAI